ncbi:hypothetical protein WMF38_14855 [Sorangium sp. So ce118]
MLENDFQDFLTALSAAGVRHLVVGAYAMASHGHVRATGDLDTWVEATPDNAERLAVAIREFAGAELIAAKRAAIELRPPGSPKALQDAADLAWLESKRAGRRNTFGTRAARRPAMAPRALVVLSERARARQAAVRCARWALARVPSLQGVDEARRHGH